MVVTAKFDRISFLKVGESVDILGRIMGEVIAINKSGDDIFVDLEIDPETRLPKSTLAVLYQPSFLGGRGITLYTEDSCMVGPCLSDGDTILGEVKTHKENVSEMLDPYLPVVDKITAFTVGDSMAFEYYLTKSNKQLGQLDKQTKRLTRSLTTNDIKKLLSQTNNQLGRLQQLLTDTSQQSNLLDMTMLEKLLADGFVQKVSLTIDSSLEKVQQYTNKIDTGRITFDRELDKIAVKVNDIINNNDSTWSALLYDSTVRDSLKNNLRSTSFLLKDIRLNPKKYISLR